MSHFRQTIKKNIGKSMMYYQQSNEMLTQEAANVFNEMKSIRKPETIILRHRLLEVKAPGK